MCGATKYKTGLKFWKYRPINTQIKQNEKKKKNMYIDHDLEKIINNPPLFTQQQGKSNLND